MGTFRAQFEDSKLDASYTDTIVSVASFRVLRADAAEPLFRYRVVIPWTAETEILDRLRVTNQGEARPALHDAVVRFAGARLEAALADGSAMSELGNEQQ